MDALVFSGQPKVRLPPTTALPILSLPSSSGVVPMEAMNELADIGKMIQKFKKKPPASYLCHLCFCPVQFQATLCSGPFT